jgi:hypothetical protein
MERKLTASYQEHSQFCSIKNENSSYMKSIQEIQENQSSSCYYNLENKSDLSNSLMES